MNCQKSRLLFSAYLDGELKLKQKAQLEAHLAGCSECSKLLNITRNLTQELKNLPEIEPSSELLRKLYLIPETYPAKQDVSHSKKFSGWKFWLSPALQPILTSLTVVMIALSLLFFTTPGKSIKKSAALEMRRTYSFAQKTLVKAGVIKDTLQGYGENFIASLEARRIYKSENN